MRAFIVSLALAWCVGCSPAYMHQLTTNGKIHDLMGSRTGGDEFRVVAIDGGAENRFATAYMAEIPFVNVQPGVHTVVVKNMKTDDRTKIKINIEPSAEYQIQASEDKKPKIVKVTKGIADR